MALDEKSKREAMSAVTAARAAIERVEETGSTMPDIHQPQLDPAIEGLDLARVKDWRDVSGIEEDREQKREMHRDLNVPGE
jgi:hypothetical protein